MTQNALFDAMALGYPPSVLGGLCTVFLSARFYYSWNSQIPLISRHVGADAPLSLQGLWTALARGFLLGSDAIHLLAAIQFTPFSINSYLPIYVISWDL